jgi:hypothetical protein
LGAKQDMETYTDVVAALFGELYGREPVHTQPEALLEMVGEATPVR